MACIQEIKARSDRSPVEDQNLTDALNCSDIDMVDEARVPKARKPYTITKQREKWSEDEHKLFLEALQLHGRAWRRIQEHIGTKTAVQIRSHAQKFFSKVSQPSRVKIPLYDLKKLHGLSCLQADVTHESSGDNINSSGSAPSIQIPPPRPKRRPVHPYPRKLGNTPLKHVPAIKQLEKPHLQEQSLYEPGSPTSEILGSDSSGSPASTIDIEERCPTPSIATADLAVELSPTNVKEPMRSDTSEEVTCDRLEAPVLRLFGKRVVVNDLHQLPNPEIGNLHTAADMDLDVSAETPTSGTGKFSTHDATEENIWNPWMTNTHQFMYYLPHGEFLSMHSALPCFIYNNGGVPLPQFSNEQHHHQPSEAVDYKCMQREGSWTESNTASNGVPETASRNSETTESCRDANRSEDEMVPVPGSRKFVSRASNCKQGFVPYKRCAAESEVLLQSHAPTEEADRDMTRLCL